MAFQEIHELLFFCEAKHDIEHDELRRCHNRCFAKMFFEYFCRVHPPEIGVFMRTVQDIANIVQMFFMFSIFGKINIFVVL